MSTFRHETAEVHPTATIGDDTKVWSHAQIREKAVLGRGCIISKGAYIDAGVVLGDNCKVQNYACVYQHAVLEDGVFIGPHAVLTNDRVPRAVNPDGSTKGAADWHVGTTTIRRGAAIGARAVLLPDLEIGAWAIVAAGAVVTRNVPAHGLVVGSPAKVVGWVCRCGAKVPAPAPGQEAKCESCRRTR